MACNRTAIPGLDLEYEARRRKRRNARPRSEETHLSAPEEESMHGRRRCQFLFPNSASVVRALTSVFGFRDLAQCFRVEEAVDIGTKRKQRLKTPPPPPTEAEVRTNIACDIIITSSGFLSGASLLLSCSESAAVTVVCGTGNLRLKDGWSRCYPYSTRPPSLPLFLPLPTSHLMSSYFISINQLINHCSLRPRWRRRSSHGWRFRT